MIANLYISCDNKYLCIEKYGYNKKFELQKKINRMYVETLLGRLCFNLRKKYIQDISWS